MDIELEVKRHYVVKRQITWYHGRYSSKKFPWEPAMGTNDYSQHVTTGSCSNEIGTSVNVYYEY